MSQVIVVLKDLLSFFYWFEGNDLQVSMVFGGWEDGLTVGIFRVIGKLGAISVIDEQVACGQVDGTVKDDMYLLVL